MKMPVLCPSGTNTMLIAYAPTREAEAIRVVCGSAGDRGPFGLRQPAQVHASRRTFAANRSTRPSPHVRIISRPLGISMRSGCSMTTSVKSSRTSHDGIRDCHEVARWPSQSLVMMSLAYARTWVLEAEMTAAKNSNRGERICADMGGLPYSDRCRVWDRGKAIYGGHRAS